MANPRNTTPKACLAETSQGPDLRQDPRPERPERDQRQAHAEAEREQGRGAARHVPGLGDVEQGRGERRRHAGADDQGGGEAHDRGAAEGAEPAAAQAGQAGGGTGRQREVERTEHRQRQGGEGRGEQAQRHGRLERDLEVASGPGRGHAERAVGQRHRERVGAGQGETPPGREPLSGAGQHAGQHRNHREHARREGQEQAEPEEGRQDAREMAGEQTAPGLGLRIDRGRTRGQRWVRRNGRRLRTGRRHLDDPGDRRVADAPLGTALVGDAHVAYPRKRRARHDGLGRAVVDLGRPEVRVVLGFSRSGRHGKLPTATVRRADLVSVEVGAGGDGPSQAKREVLVAGHVESERHLPCGGLAAMTRRRQR